MKQQAQARADQQYTRRTPVRCGTCRYRDGEKCGIGGFTVALWGVCGLWAEQGKKTSNPAA